MENLEKPKLDSFTANLVAMAMGSAPVQESTKTEGSAAPAAPTGQASKELDEGTLKGISAMLKAASAFVEPSVAAPTKVKFVETVKAVVDEQTLNESRFNDLLKAGHKIVGQMPALRRGEIKDMKEFRRWEQNFAKGTAFMFYAGVYYALRKLEDANMAMKEAAHPPIDVRLRRDPETKEWIGAVYVKGKFDADKSYFGGAEADDKQDVLNTIKLMRKEYRLSEGKLAESVQEWMASKINASLIELGVPEDQHKSIEDTIYASALAGKLGDGTPSDETAAQIQSMVAELAAVNAAPTPAPTDVEPEGDIDVTGAGENMDLEGEQNLESPDLSTEADIDAELERLSGLDVEPDVKEDDIDPAVLAKGIAVEKEHTDDEDEAKRIALVHIGERPDYYDQLDKMEKKPVEEHKTESLTQTVREQRQMLFDVQNQDQTYVAVQKHGEIIAQRMSVRQARHMLFDIEAQDEPSPYLIRIISTKMESMKTIAVGKSVMVEHLGELVEGKVVKSTDNKAHVALDEGILIIVDLRNVTPMDVDDEYINRVDAGEPLESIIESIAQKLVIGGRIC